MISDDTDIAIVGMAGLYPQADDIDIFWSNILAKKDCVTESSDDWLGVGDIYDATHSDPLRIYTRRGGFLGDLSRFDPRQFGTMPRAMDGQPDQFLALRVAHDALVDAGYVPGKFDGQATGVILGHSVHGHRGNTNGIQQIWVHSQFRHMLKALFPDLPPDRIEDAIEMMTAKLPPLEPEGVPGLVPNVMTGRICNRLDLMGPNYIIDAACSSSIIAVDLAIGELLGGRADMMLAGGVNTTTSPLVYSVFCSVNALSEDGRIRPFDQGANGTVLGEGAGVLVLKRLKDALAADDRIYAVIKGVGQSSDGKSSGLMAPRLEGERLAVNRAYANTGIDPATIGLIEAHGTGIPLGDKTEIEALREVFGSRDGSLPRIPIGSVKSMIGHCIPASGSAGIIKMALSLDHKIIPPTLCDEVSGDIGLKETGMYVSTQEQPWIHSASYPRRAATNAFGFGGINAHMILEESPVGMRPDPTTAFLPRDVGQQPAGEQVLVFAGADRAAVLDAIDAVLADDAADLIALAAQSWDSLAETTGAARLAVVASDLDDMNKKIATVRTKLPDLPEGGTLQTRNGIYYEDEARVAAGGGKVGFLFPGEMAQYPGMMADVAMAYPVVRDWFDFIASLTDGRREVPLQTVIYPPATLVDEAGQKQLEGLMHQVDYGSEMVFAADQAVFSLLSGMGIRADAMLGHSTGENAALVASGRLGLDRERIGQMIADMNTIFTEVEQSGKIPQGVLINVAAMDREGLEGLLARHPGLHFTMDNCPNQAILFGQKADVDALQRNAVAAGAVCTLLPISWGYHTEYVKPLADEFDRLFEALKSVKKGTTLYSCGTAKPFPASIAAFKKTAVAQYTSRVRFTEAVEKMYEDGVRVFVECGPNAVLSSFVRDILGSRPHLAVAADNRKRGMQAQLRHLVAQLFAAGVPMDPRAFLVPAESAAQTRRRANRDKQRAAPALASELGFIRFDAAEEQALRDLLIPQPAAGTVAAPDMPAAAPPAGTIPGQAHAPAAQGHADQGTALPQTPANTAPPGSWGPQPPRSTIIARPPRRARPGLSGRASNGAANGADNRIEVVDLSRGFGLPFPFSAYLMQKGANPSMAAIWPHLTSAEQKEAQALAAQNLHGQGWREWCLSRLAVKRAVGAILGQDLPGAGIDIRKHEGGAPYVSIAGITGLPPSISISHAGATGVGAAAAPGWRIGIDYELPGRIHNPASFLEAVAGEQEHERLNLPVSAESVAMIWSLKEAAAKALGVGFQGRPHQFVICSSDLAQGIAQVQHEQYVVQCCIRSMKDAVCAVAWLPDSAFADAA